MLPEVSSKQKLDVHSSKHLFDVIKRLGKGEKGKLFSITIIVAHFSNLSTHLAGGNVMREKRVQEADKCRKTQKTMINDSKVYKQK